MISMLQIYQCLYPLMLLHLNFKPCNSVSFENTLSIGNRMYLREIKE